MQLKLIPLVLSGGVGSRLWPLSRKDFPKQFWSLTSDQSLLAETVKRVSEKVVFSPPIVVCNADHRFLVAEQLRQAGVKKARIILEPQSKSTAPAITAACELIKAEDEEACVLVVPSDHTIADPKAFRHAIKKGVLAANAGALVTFGIEPTHAETGYGYIKVGPQSDISEVFRIETFTEKPDNIKAKKYLSTGDYLWNSGMFMFKVSVLLGEIMKYAPKIQKACKSAVSDASFDIDFLRLDSKSFQECPNGAIDTVLMEKSTKTVVIPVSMGWSDVGSWNTLWNLGPKDHNQNVLIGKIANQNTKNCYIRGTNKLVAALGIENIVVVDTEDAVLVLHKTYAQDLSTFVKHLKTDGWPETETSLTGHRPWGYFKEIDKGAGFKVKRIVVQPGARLSYQMHHHRSEHWVIVEGTAKVTKGEKTFTLKANESAYIPATVRHRLENIGKEPLHVIEVQTGSYLEEDDIVRFDDLYKRT